MDLLFVYGTLRSGYDNVYARRLRAESEFVGVASVRGSIVQLSSYPGFRPVGNEEVAGELYRLADPISTLAVLDEYEGEEYARNLIRVSTGEEAWIYEYVGGAPQ